MTPQVEAASPWTPLEHASAWRASERDRFVLSLQAHPSGGAPAAPGEW